MECKPPSTAYPIISDLVHLALLKRDWFAALGRLAYAMMGRQSHPDPGTYSWIEIKLTCPIEELSKETMLWRRTLTRIARQMRDSRESIGASPRRSVQIRQQVLRDASGSTASIRDSSPAF